MTIAERLPDLPDPGALPEQARKWVKPVAKDLGDFKSMIVVGPRQPAWVHAVAFAINHALGAYSWGSESVGAFGQWIKPPVLPSPTMPEVSEKSIRELSQDISAGKVSTLLVIGGNPAFNAPADLNFRAELQKVATKIRLGLFHDQTSEACDWHLPLAHHLESWATPRRRTARFAAYSP
jgi:molybdopterin-containing oxidoreductase family iron-sulfur binding subunit